MYIHRIMPSIVFLDPIKGLSDQQLCKALWDEITIIKAVTIREVNAANQSSSWVQSPLLKCDNGLKTQEYGTETLLGVVIGQKDTMNLTTTLKENFNSCNSLIFLIIVTCNCDLTNVETIMEIALCEYAPPGSTRKINFQLEQ